MTLKSQRPGPTNIVSALAAVAILTFALVAFIIFQNSSAVVEKLSEQALSSSVELTHVKLHTFFESLQANLLMAHDWGGREPFDLSSNASLNARFIPVLARQSAVTSMLIADSQGREYMLLKEKSGWVTRRVDLKNHGNETRWSRWSEDGELTEEWVKELDYDSRRRPWYQGAMQVESGDVAWTAPYIFFTTRDVGMTASTRFQSRGGEEFVIAFDVMLKDLSEFTSELTVSPNGIAAVVTKEGKVVGLPKHEVYAKNPEDYLLKPLSELDFPALQVAWQNGVDASANVVSTSDDGLWWVVVKPFKLGNKELWTLVAAPEKDFVPPGTNYGLLWIVLLVPALAIGVVLTHSKLSPEKRTEPRSDPSQVGPYILLEKIGEGGTGEVYLATHKMLNRPAALKLLRRGEDRRTRELFATEVQVTAKLNHPHTVVVYDFGRTQDDTLYFAMEYLEGATLNKVVDHVGRCPVSRVIHILEQLAESLEDAHLKGFIHRDIKPENVFLSKKGQIFDYVKVLDFGLVREINATLSSGKTTRLMGTPGYIAPECADVGYVPQASADIYAVGALAYYLLAGKPAYEGSSRVSIFAQQVSDVPPPPSEKSGVPIPADLEKLIMQCLSIDPKNRPPNMTALLSRLRTSADYGTWTQVDAEAWWSTNNELKNDSSGNQASFSVSKSKSTSGRLSI